MSDDEKLKIYLSYRKELILYAIPLTGSREMAEDVVQDAWFRFADANNPDNPAAYLYRIVRNLALDVVRRLKLEARHQPQTAEDDDELDHGWLAPSTLPEPERTLDNQEQLRHVTYAVDALPEKARQALEMYRLGGHRLEDIARELDVSLSSAHRLVQQSLVKIALHLDQVNQANTE